MNTNVLESVLPLSNMLLSRINFWGFLPYILLWLQNKNMPPAPYFKFFVFFWLIYPYFFICSKMSADCFSFLKPSLTIPTWPLPLCHLICCGQASHYTYVDQQISTKLSDFFLERLWAAWGHFMSFQFLIFSHQHYVWHLALKNIAQVRLKQRKWHLVESKQATKYSTSLASTFIYITIYKIDN